MLENDIISITNTAANPARIQDAVINHAFVGLPFIPPLDFAQVPPTADGDRMIKIHEACSKMAIEEYKFIDDIKVALIACCPPAAKDLVRSIGTDRTTMPLAKMLSVLKMNYGTPNATDIDAEVAALAAPFRLGGDMLTHVNKMRMILTTLASHGAPLSSLEEVRSLQNSVSAIRVFDLAVNSYHLTHPNSAQAKFDDLASLLITASRTSAHTASLNSATDSSPLGNLYAATRPSRSRPGSPSSKPSLASAEYAAIWRAAQALPPPTGHDPARPKRPASPHPGGRAAVPRTPYKNPTRSEVNCNLCIAHGWNATHKSAECRHLKRQAAPA